MIVMILRILWDIEKSRYENLNVSAAVLVEIRYSNKLHLFEFDEINPKIVDFHVWKETPPITILGNC